MLYCSTSFSQKSTQGLQRAALTAQVAQFGAPIPDGGLVGYVVRARPPNACGPLTYEVHEDDIDFWVKPKILLVQQGPCSFSDQVLKFQCSAVGNSLKCFAVRLLISRLLKRASTV